MEQKVLILDAKASLVGKDLANVYRHFKQCPTKFSEDFITKFKKKESLENMAKSILKHRIKLLTGKSATEIEEEIEHESPDGSGLSVQELRQMAHLLILEASGELPTIASPPKRPAKEKPVLSDKRPNGVSQQATSSTRRTRKSLAPEMLRKQEEKVDCRLKPAVVIDDLDLGPNPTPQMIDRKRRSLAVATLQKSKKSPQKLNASLASNTPRRTRKAIKIVEEEPPKETKKNVVVADEVPKPAKKSPVKRKADEQPPAEKRPRRSLSRVVMDTIVKPVIETIAPKVDDAEPEPEFPGDECSIFLARSELTSLKLSAFSQAKGFHGANLAVLHTPMSWDPSDVFNMVMAIRYLNRECKLRTFTVLVGCGLSNVHMIREALQRQTKHVQFLVFDREDADLEHNPGKLRDVNSFFLLAYFFEGCDKERVSEIPQMVRPGQSTNIRTKSVEDLENQIVHIFTEKGDWILDIFCGERELTLAAQKSGRNAIAIDNRQQPLNSLKTKARLIAAHFDKEFDTNKDGIILQF